MPIYNQIGKTYNTTRKADPRITGMILQQLKLKPSSTILDIGAGTGNYSYELADKGYHVIALEPSEVMRTQGRQHENLTWKEGAAERIPLEDTSVDGIICTLASHHFHDLSLSFQEMRRVLKENGKIVIFTLDPRLCEEECWLFDYFGPVLEGAYRIHPPVKELSQLLEEQIERPVTMVPYPLPYDLVDQFFFSSWRAPDRYLDRDFQRGTSPLAEGEEVNPCLEHLQTDLKNGHWNENYRNVLNLDEYDCGHFFLVI